MSHPIARGANDEFIRTAFERCPSGLLVVDSEGRIVVVNEEVERLFGYSRTELLGQPVEMLVPERFVAGHTGHRAHFAKHPGARRMGGGREVYGRHRDGHDVDLEVGLSTIETADGVFVLSTLVDVTERRKLEERLRQTHKVEAVGNLASGIAHDFNNILLGIMGYTELVCEALPDNHAAQEDLGVVIDTAKRGRSLVNRILLFTRQTEPTRSRTSLTQSVREAMQLVVATLPANVEIRQGFDAATPEVVADSMELQQIVMNLASNATHAMKLSGGVLEVHVGPVMIDRGMLDTLPELQPGLHARISVSDSGAGIPAEVLPRIFEPFFSTKARGEGTGLGLSVIARIVRSLGGAISVRTETGSGTCFCVYLPAAPRISDFPGHLETESRGRGWVLHVEDEAHLSRLGKRVLEQADFRVVAHTSSLQALEEFRADPQRFDLVVTDNTMPHMTGLELVSRVLEIRPDVPVLMVSGIGESMSHDELRQRGVSRILSKPYLAAELRAAALELVRATEGNAEQGTPGRAP